MSYHDNLERKGGAGDDPLSVNDMLVTVNDFLASAPGYDVIAESGDMLFGGLEVRVPAPGIYMAQGFYASMGFGIPAAIGAQIGTGRRPLVLCGDGAFQMTGVEISHAPKRGLNPIVVLVNNEGWSIFRPVTPRQELLEIPNWPYAQMAEGWGGLGFRAATAGELREALREAHGSHQFALIECTIPRDDLSPISRRYIEASAKKASAGGSAS
ncbi:MAG: hypothetical protein HKP27_06880 [Myxococcales bacterium]|nr:hypothetical protein [Myxococcales bacterium]